MTQPLYVAFIWHMHQPFYKDSLTGRYFLPWVRLHGAKDYLHMAEVLAQFPRIHATFNLVPSLVIQLEEYAAGSAVDQALALSLKETWTPEEKGYLLRFFFSINWDRIIRRYQRYEQLLRLREEALADPTLFSDEYYRDLVAWFNLAWIDPNWLERDPDLRALVKKGRHFSPGDIRLILAKQREIIARIIPLYRELEAKGQVELITSPYYHPILPLLIDARVARRVNAALPLPSVPFACPEDADEQLRKAVEFHQKRFGRRPRGLWPPEGAVCEETAYHVARHGFAWFASDESVLARSLDMAIERDGYGHVVNPRPLYQPYRIEGSPLAVVFRDHFLSDQIGFVYQHMEGKTAAEDLIARLHHIRQTLADPHNPYLVTIILDGENCWEAYEHNGDIFLRHLYALLSQDSELCTVTVSEYLERHPPRQALPRLATGSWVGGLETWIGEAGQNQAWEYLTRTRERLLAWQRENPLLDMETLERAWEEIYIAEGSDWFWWYYSHNTSSEEGLFDEAFRRHLVNVHLVLGLPVPGWLSEPLLGLKASIPLRVPTAYISPPLTASPEAPPQWDGAGYLEPRLSSGPMQRAATLIHGLYYGYDASALYLRLELNEPVEPYTVAFYLSTPRAPRANHRVRLAETSPTLRLASLRLTWEIELAPGEEEGVLNRAEGQELWARTGTVTTAKGEKVVELAVPFEQVGVKTGDNVGLVVTLARDGVLVEALPSSDVHVFALSEGR